MICPACRNTIAATGDNFCYKCGSPMKEDPDCMCGRTLGPHDRFCPRCGKRVQASVEIEAEEREIAHRTTRKEKRD